MQKKPIKRIESKTVGIQRNKSHENLFSYAKTQSFKLQLKQKQEDLQQSISNRMVLSFGSQTQRTSFNQTGNAHNKNIVFKKDEYKETFMEAIEMLRQCAVRCFKNKFKQGCIDSLNMIIRCCLVIPDIFLLKSSLKLLGFLYIFFNKMKYAVSCFEKLRDVSDEDHDFQTVMFAYKQLGLCFQKVQEYEKAIVCFKSILQYAWKENNIEYEMQAYDFLGLQYYYLGQLDNAKYYHERMVRGKFESKKSNLRGLSEEQYKKKELQKEERFKKVNIIEEVDQATGREKIVVKEVKDYSHSKEIKDLAHNFLQKLTNDLQLIVQNTKVPQNLKKISEPARLYQQTQQEEEDISPEEKSKSKFLNIKQKVTKKLKNQMLLSTPRIYIRQGTSIFEKNDKDLPSPKSVNSKGKNVCLLPHFLQPEEIEEEHSEEEQRANEEHEKELEELKFQMKEQPGYMTRRTSFINNIQDSGASQQLSARAMTSELKIGGNLQSRTKIVETFQMIRANSNKSYASKSHFTKKGSYVDYFAQIRQTKAWKRRMDTGPKAPFEFNMKDLFKKIELSKSEGPHYLLFLKHLSPIHNLKYAKDIEDKNYIRILKKFSDYKRDVQQEQRKIYLKEESSLMGRIVKTEVNYVDESQIPMEWLATQTVNVRDEDSVISSLHHIKGSGTFSKGKNPKSTFATSHRFTQEYL